MSEALLVFTTFASAEEARPVISRLIEERLVACGTMLPGAESIYRWQGAIESAPEVVVIFKTLRARLDVLEARLLELHPYDTPEVVAVLAERVAPGYLEWLRAAVTV